MLVFESRQIETILESKDYIKDYIRVHTKSMFTLHTRPMSESKEACTDLEKLLAVMQKNQKNSGTQENISYYLRHFCLPVENRVNKWQQIATLEK